MGTRSELHEKLCSTLGSRNVYFQPPENLKMSYPCIVYSRIDINNSYANNSVYSQNNHYQLIYISKDPDSQVPSELTKLNYCQFDRHYVQNNLYHDVLNIYY